METERLDVIITAPHRCVTPKRLDPGCDAGSGANARAIYAGIQSVVSEGKAYLFLGDVARKHCDLNRASCPAISEMRRKLTKQLRYQANNQIPFLLFDIHAFSGGRDFRVLGNVEVVLLSLPENRRLAKVLARYLGANGIDVAALTGSDKNHILVEATDAGGHAVLVEMLETTRLGDLTFKKTLKSIQQTVQHMKRRRAEEESMETKLSGLRLL